MKNPLPILSFEHVHFAYGHQEVLRDVCMDVHQGVLLPFVGPNGAGKTTLLRLALGLLRPSAGRVQVFGSGGAPGFVPQQKAIDPIYPVSTRQIIEMGLFPELGVWRKPGGEMRRRVDAVLERLGLSEHQCKMFGELSGGMKQKALLGRALAGRAEVYILDEPTSELDEASEQDVLGHLRALCVDEGKTVLMAHHGLAQAWALAETVCEVNHGRVRLVKAEERLAGHA